MGQDHALICPLGVVPYRRSWALQEALKERMVQAKRAQPPQFMPHVVLLLEHPPVYTLGRSGDAAHLLVDEERLKSVGAEYYRVDRGGDITFHGPGQLVAYFLLDLDRLFRDLHRLMRLLEEVVIRTLADFGVAAVRVSGSSGVWVGPPGAERKVCAQGIRCSRWVTMHGIALNLNTDLTYYHHIVPCGISNRAVTSLSQELGQRCDEARVRRLLVHHCGQVFGLATEMLSKGEAFIVLEELSGISGLASSLRGRTLKAAEHNFMEGQR